MARQETADSMEAKHLEAVVNAVAASSTFQALVNVDSAAEALGSIIEADGGDQWENDGTGLAISAHDDLVELQLPATHAYVDVGAWDGSETGLRSVWRTGAGLIQLYLKIPDGYKPPDRLRYALNQGGTIAADVRALFGTAGYMAFTDGSPFISEVEIPKAGASWEGYAIVSLRLDWSS